MDAIAAPFAGNFIGAFPPNAILTRNGVDRLAISP
jgi:hypothetical protein